MDTSLAHENARQRALLQTQQDTNRQMAEYNHLLSQRVTAYASEINWLKALADEYAASDEADIPRQLSDLLPPEEISGKKPARLPLATHLPRE